jgi:hypothetical protein
LNNPAAAQGAPVDAKRLAEISPLKTPDFWHIFFHGIKN